MLSPEIFHLIAGGIGATVAALLTSPLEVVKVRLQASLSNHGYNVDESKMTTSKNRYKFCSRMFHQKNEFSRPGVIGSIRLIIRKEGVAGLFRGVGPTLVGVIPSRSIFFFSYNYSQFYFNKVFKPDSHSVFFCSASMSGAIAATVTNPIWYIKTRLQLDFGAGNKKLTIMKIIRNTYKENGIRGFYRGVTASYAGISETGINFMIYEYLKMRLFERFRESDQSPENSTSSNDDENHMSKLQNFTDMFLCMGASATSKTIATTIAYPHEVARTRLREEGNKYKGFFQTLLLVFREEGVRGLYRGLFTHYLRQVPNTCIMMGVYEGLVLLIDRWGLDDCLEEDDVDIS